MAHLLAHTVLPLCCVLALALAALHCWMPAASARLSSRLDTRFFLTLSLTMCAVYLAAMLLTASFPASIDPVEVSVISTASLWLRGQPLYTTLTAPGRYSLLYGPLCDLSYAAPIALFGARIATVKLALLVFNGAMIATLWTAFRRNLSRPATVIALGMTLSALMMKQMPTFLLRGDVLLALMIALALLATTIGKNWLAAPVLTLACAFAVDIKFTVALSFLVPFYLLWRRHGSKTLFLAIVAVPLFAALPFLLPNVSFPNYLAWVQQAQRHPLFINLFAMNLVAAAILVAPPAAMLWALYRAGPAFTKRLLKRHCAGIALFAVSLIGAILTGSKVGAGRSHLVPLLIVAAWVTTLLWSRLASVVRHQHHAGQRYAALVFAVLLLVPALAELQDLWQICIVRRPYAQSVNADLNRILQANPGKTIEMGYGASPPDGEPVDFLSAFSPRLVFAGNPLTLDAMALFDMGLSGVPIPPSTLNRIRTCQTQIWLIPQGQEPFTLLNAYVNDVPNRFPDPTLFPPEFRQVFLATYKATSKTRFYDLWSCPRQPAPRP